MSLIVAPFVTTWPTLHCLTKICGSNDGSNLFSQVQELGLQVAYSEDQGTYGWIRKLLALPFLPHTEITQFERLRLGSEGPRKDLEEYIAWQWIYYAIFPGKDWSIFMQPIRTNNDIQGWHSALNRRVSGRCSLPFYVLIQLLNREARLVEVQMRLVADHKLARIQRRKYRVLYTILHDRWEQYLSRKKTSRQLLKPCSQLYGLTQQNGPKKIFLELLVRLIKLSLFTDARGRLVDPRDHCISWIGHLVKDPGNKIVNEDRSADVHLPLMAKYFDLACHLLRGDTFNGAEKDDTLSQSLDDVWRDARINRESLSAHDDTSCPHFILPRWAWLFINSLWQGEWWR